jgi:hypothetical protein
LNSYEESKKLYGIVERTVIKIMKQMNFVRAIPSVVTGVSGSNITAYLAGDDPGNTSVYQNRTNSTILIGDIVYVVLPNGSNATSAFIGWKQ